MAGWLKTYSLRKYLIVSKSTLPQLLPLLRST